MISSPFTYFCLSVFDFLFLFFFFLLNFWLESSPIHEAILKRHCFIIKLGKRCPVSIVFFFFFFWYVYFSSLHVFLILTTWWEEANHTCQFLRQLVAHHPAVTKACGSPAHCALEAVVVVAAAPLAEATVNREFWMDSAEVEEA